MYPSPVFLGQICIRRALYTSESILRSGRGDQYDHDHCSILLTTSNSVTAKSFQRPEIRPRNSICYRSIVSSTHRAGSSSATADRDRLVFSACFASIMRLILVLRIDPEDQTCKSTLLFVAL